MAIPDDRPDIGIAAVIGVLSPTAADGAVESPVFVEREKVHHAPLLPRCGALSLSG
jgi:hypothetical protein